MTKKIAIFLLLSALIINSKAQINTTEIQQSETKITELKEIEEE